jgi:hypothetical protein
MAFQGGPKVSPNLPLAVFLDSRGLIRQNRFIVCFTQWSKLEVPYADSTIAASANHKTGLLARCATHVSVRVFFVLTPFAIPILFKL